MKQRRICVPFDKVCLEGGCGYCNSMPFRYLWWIEGKARDKGLTMHYWYGYENNFFNAETR